MQPKPTSERPSSPRPPLAFVLDGRSRSHSTYQSVPSPLSRPPLDTLPYTSSFPTVGSNQEIYTYKSELLSQTLLHPIAPFPPIKLTSFSFDSGFNSASLDLTFNLWDIGGQTALRQSWSQFYTKTKAVILVVDSTDRVRLGLVREELGKLMAAEVSEISLAIL